MAKFLLDKGADPNLFGKAEGPLHKAALRNHLKMVRLLLDHGADPTGRNCGWSPLSAAIKWSRSEAIALLLQVEITDHAVRNAWLERSLRYACEEGKRDVVLQLLRAGANVNAPEEEGFLKGANPPPDRHPKWPRANRSTTNPTWRPTRHG
jgi:ankyrin repeat protein